MHVFRRRNVVQNSKSFPCRHVSEYQILNLCFFFGSEIYAYVYNKHSSELIPFPKKKEDKHVVSGLWFMKPNKSDFMKLIHFVVEFFQ